MEEISMTQKIKRTHAKSDTPISKEELALYTRVAAGDQEAERELTERHLPLVKMVAKRYRTSGADYDDLIQEGCVGLVKALRKFKPEKGFRFSTYAHWWIRQAISRFVKGPTRLIRLPEYVHDEISQLHQLRESTQQETGRDPTDQALEKDLDWKKGRVRWLDELASDASSLDSRVKDSSGLSVLQGLPSDQEDPAEVASRRVAWEAIAGEIQNLPSRQAKILDYRYGIQDGERKSLAWIGKKIGLSSERVRQLEIRALSKLRKSSEGPRVMAA